MVDGISSQPGQVREGQRQPRRHQRAGDDLPFAADVDDAGAEGDADAQADQQQRRGLHEGLRQAEARPDHPPDHRRVRGQRIGLQDDQHHGPEKEGNDHADKGQEDVQDDPAPLDAWCEPRARAVDGRLWGQQKFLSAYLYHTRTPPDRKIS